MALTECPECKAQVSDTVRQCPHCGFHVKKCCGHGQRCFPLLPFIFLGTIIIVFLIIFCAVTVNVNSNNGLINFHWNRRGIFPKIRCACRCGGRK